jgi:hypothetical protein
MNNPHPCLTHNSGGIGSSNQEIFSQRGSGIVPVWPPEVATTMDTAFHDKLGLENQHINSGAAYFTLCENWDGSDVFNTLTKNGANAAQRMPDKGNLGAMIQKYHSKPCSIAKSLCRDYIKATNTQGGFNGNAEKRRPNLVLQTLWEENGEKEVLKWGVNVSVALYEAEVLRNVLLQNSNERQPSILRKQLQCEDNGEKEDERRDKLRELRNSTCKRCPSYRWCASEQCSTQFDEVVQILSYEDSQKEEFVQNMSKACKRLGIL